MGQGRGAVHVTPGLLIWFALLILLLPIRWIVAWIFAVFLHESGHFLMLKLLGIDVCEIRVGIQGVNMQTGFLLPWQELMSSLAGPLMGAAVFLLAPRLPRLAVCCGFQTIYNLLPVYPLDGGRALRSSLHMIFGQPVALKICNITEGLCIVGMIWLGIYATIRLKLGLIPLLLAAIPVIRCLQIKIPCKETKQAVQ